MTLRLGLLLHRSDMSLPPEREREGESYRSMTRLNTVQIDWRSGESISQSGNKFSRKEWHREISKIRDKSDLYRVDSFSISRKISAPLLVFRCVPLAPVQIILKFLIAFQEASLFMVCKFLSEIWPFLFSLKVLGSLLRSIVIPIKPEIRHLLSNFRMQQEREIDICFRVPFFSR